MTYYYHDINNAIKSLHARYGKGDILSIYHHDAISSLKTKITVTAQRVSCKPHEVIGQLIKNGNKTTIKIYRRQMTVKII